MKFSIWQSIGWFCLVLVFVPVGCFSANLQTEDELNCLDEVWALVAENHYDPELHGLSWALIHQEYRQRIRESNSRDESYRHIDAMLQELGDSHGGFGHLKNAARATSPYLFGNGTVGLNIRLINGEAIVTQVIPESSAAHAGIRSGFRLLSLDEYSIQQICQNASLRPPFTASNEQFHQTEAVLWRLFGTPGTLLRVDFEDEASNQQTVMLHRRQRPGGINLYPSFPPVFVEVEEQELPRGIRYLRFNAFQPDHPARILAAIDGIKTQVPLILDLRGNNGGSAMATQEILGRFARDPFLAYYRVGRDDSTAIYVEPTGPGHCGEVVILVDELSISAAENFAAIMQHAGLAQVVGSRTPGQLLWGEGFVLGDSLMAVIPVAKIVYPKGESIEGQGVAPDLEVPLQREDLLRGIDSQLQAALSVFTGVD